jgi:ribonuclease HI
VKTVRVYVDGSYSSLNPNVVGWAYYSEEDSKLRGSGTLQGPVAEMNQVGGELAATMRAVRHAARLGYEQVTILYDYNGVVHWATGGWRPKKEWTKAYAEWMRNMNAKYGGHIHIRFEKCEAKHNPADRMARAMTGAKNRH